MIDVDERLERLDHALGDERDLGRELGAVLRRGRELGADDEQLALEPDQELVELGPALGLGTRQPERRHRFVDRAVGIGAERVLGDPSSVQQAGRAVVTRARVARVAKS